jgi:hypothetical protein
MIATCEFVLRFLGEGLVGVAAAVVAGLAIYLPVIFPMRALLRRSGAGRPALDEVRAA